MSFLSLNLLKLSYSRTSLNRLAAVVSGGSNAHHHVVPGDPSRRHIHHMTTISQINGHVIQTPTKRSNINVELKRFKKKRRKATEEQDEEEDEEDLSGENPLLVDDILNPVDDGEKLVIDCASLRLDAVCKGAFKLARLKVEEVFYKGDIYLNGEKPHKKSELIHKGDELDLIRNINTENSNEWIVDRVFIDDIPDACSTAGRYNVTIKLWKKLTIPAHSRDSTKHDTEDD